MSSTVTRALSLLTHFSGRDPELGLTELAARAELDKGTVHRLLATLAAAGFVDQDPDTKRYCLGAEPLRLARVRETSRPVRTLVAPALARLTERTGETAHAALLGGTTLGTVGVSPSRKAARVFLEDGETLPLHATASGLAVLAFSDEAFVATVLDAAPLHPFTARTETDPAALRERLAVVRRRGYAEVDQSFEDDVHGIAAPLFGTPGRVSGSIAVATPAHRMTRTHQRNVVRAVREAAAGITAGLGGEPPSGVVTRRDRAEAS